MARLLRINDPGAFYNVTSRGNKQFVKIQDPMVFLNEEIDRVAHIISELSDFSEPKSQPGKLWM